MDSALYVQPVAGVSPESWLPGAPGFTTDWVTLISLPTPTGKTSGGNTAIIRWIICSENNYEVNKNRNCTSRFEPFSC